MWVEVFNKTVLLEQWIIRNVYQFNVFHSALSKNVKPLNQRDI